MRIKGYHVLLKDAGTVDEAEPLIVHEGEYDLETCLDWEFGEPKVSVIGIYDQGRDLYASSDPWVKQLAARVADVAEDDDWVIDQVVQDYTDNHEAAA